MLGLVCCAVVISLSSLIGDESATEEGKDLWPPYVAVLGALLMPMTGACMNLVSKYVTVDLKMSANDWTFGYFLIMSTMLQIAEIAHFLLKPEMFVTRIYV